MTVCWGYTLDTSAPPVTHPSSVTWGDRRLIPRRPHPSQGGGREGWIPPPHIARRDRLPRPPPQTPPIVRYRGVRAGVDTAPPNRTRPYLEVYLGFRVGDSCIPQLRGDEGEDMVTTA